MARCQDSETNGEYRPVQGSSPIHPESCVRPGIPARDPHGQHECAAEKAGHARKQTDDQRYADKEFAVANGKSYGSGCVGQNPPENRNHERVRSIANESTDIVAKARVHESGSEDFVLTEDDEEEPNGDAQKGQRNGIGVALPLE